MNVTAADMRRLANMPHVINRLTEAVWDEAPKDANGVPDERVASVCSALRMLFLVPLQSLHDDRDVPAFLGAMFAARQFVRDAAGNPGLPPIVASLYSDAALVLTGFPED